MTRAEFNHRMLKLGGLRSQPTTLDGHWELVRDRPDAHIDAAIRASLEQPFFPTPADFKDYAVAAQITESETRPIGCAACNYTGWREDCVGGVERASKCPCWRAYTQRTAPDVAGNRAAGDAIRSTVASIAGRKGM